MNFIGHAVVASWTCSDPAFVTGAMLPDFLHMTGARLASVEDDAVAAGIDCHHRVDAAFHGAPVFVGLCGRGAAELTAAGVGRGTARAVAHVGTELLLDGLLLHRPAATDVYLAALGWAHPEGMKRALRVRAAEGPRLLALGARLHAWGAPHEYRDPVFVTARLEVALASRPRLRMQPEEKPAITDWLAGQKHEVAAQVEELLAQVADRLARSD